MEETVRDQVGWREIEREVYIYIYRGTKFKRSFVKLKKIFRMLDSNKRGKIIDDNISRFNKYFTFNPYDYLLRSKGEHSRRNLDSLTDSKTLRRLSRRLSLRSSCSLRERFFTKPFMQSLFYYSHIPRSLFLALRIFNTFNFHFPKKKKKREKPLRFSKLPFYFTIRSKTQNFRTFTHDIPYFPSSSIRLIRNLPSKRKE